MSPARQRLSLGKCSADCLGVCSYLIFLLFWLPQNTFYRLFYLPAIAFLIGMAGNPRSQRFRHSIIAAVMVLFLWNFTFLIYPYSRDENNEILTFAIQHRQDWPEGTTVIFRNFHSSLWTISYFNPQVSWLEKPDAGGIMVHPIHGPVWLEGTAYDLLLENPEGREWLSVHIDMPQSLIYRSPKHGFRFYRVLPGNLISESPLKAYPNKAGISQKLFASRPVCNPC